MQPRGTPSEFDRRRRASAQGLLASHACLRAWKLGCFFTCAALHGDSLAAMTAPATPASVFSSELAARLGLVRDEAICYINGKRHVLPDNKAEVTLLAFLRGP